MNRGSITGRSKNILSPEHTRWHIRWVMREIFPPELLWPCIESNHSPTSSAEIKNEWSYTSSNSYAFMAYIETNLPFYFYMPVCWYGPWMWIMNKKGFGTKRSCRSGVFETVRKTECDRSTEKHKKIITPNLANISKSADRVVRYGSVNSISDDWGNSQQNKWVGNTLAFLCNMKIKTK